MSEHTPCIVCGLADHQSPDLPIKALRHALAWHIIYEGVTPKLLAALEESTVYLDRLVHSHIEQWPHQLRAALEHGQQAIKEAKGE